MELQSASFRPQGGPLLHIDGSEGSGMPVLFQHGLCGDARQTADAFPHVDGIRRLTVECRGHGQSEAGDVAQFSIARLAKDIEEFLDLQNFGPIVVAGISMGAAIALRLAARRPDLVSGLILVRPAWMTGAAPPNMAPNLEVGRLLTSMRPEEARAAFLQSSAAAQLSEEAPDNLASLVGFFTREPIAVTAALLRSISIDGPGLVPQDLQDVTVPTLVVGCQMDYIHPLAMAEGLAAMLPNAQFMEVTPKAHDRARHTDELHMAINIFLKEFTA